MSGLPPVVNLEVIRPAGGEGAMEAGPELEDVAAPVGGCRAFRDALVSELICGAEDAGDEQGVAGVGAVVIAGVTVALFCVEAVLGDEGTLMVEYPGAEGVGGETAGTLESSGVFGPGVFVAAGLQLAYGGGHCLHDVVLIAAAAVGHLPGNGSVKELCQSAAPRGLVYPAAVAALIAEMRQHAKLLAVGEIVGEGVMGVAVHAPGIDELELVVEYGVNGVA